MPAVASLPRTYVVFVPTAMAICSWLLVRLLSGSHHWSRFLGIGGLTVLAVEAGARVRIEASTLAAHRSLSPAAAKAVEGLQACGTWAILFAIAGGVLAARAGRSKAKWTRLAPWLMAAAFLLPLVAYLFSLTFSPALSATLRVPDPSLGVTAGASSTMAYAIFEPYIGLIYMTAALAAWQAITFAHAINDASARATRILHRFVAETANLARNRTTLLLLVALAAAKLLFDLAGYTHRLPSVLGGDAAVWTQGEGPLVWYYTLFVAVPLVALLLRRLRVEHARLSLAGPTLLLAALFALFGPVQLLLQAIADVDPALHLQPQAGSPFFVPLDVTDYTALALTAFATAYYWRRHPPAAALFGISFVIAAPGVIGSALALRAPIAGLGRWDTVVSALVFGWLLLYTMKAVRLPPPWLIAIWLGLSALVHFTILVPEHLQDSLFVLGALLPLAYSVLWAGHELNDLARDRPARSTLALCLMATILVVVAVQIWIGDRFGREFNSFINNGVVFQQTSRQLIGLPLLVLLCWQILGVGSGRETAER
jgi:hypothetical protein